MLFFYLWIKKTKEGKLIMNDKKLISKVHSAMYHQCLSRGYATPVDVLMDIGALSKEQYENWRYGRVDYLERVCTMNLRKLSVVMHEIRVYAQKNQLKPSVCYYKQWGRKKKKGTKVIPLRFSKSGDPNIEKWYATHFVDTNQINVLKAQKNQENKEEVEDERKPLSSEEGL